MLISMLKYIKVLRHVSILTDRHQGVCLYLVKVTELFLKNTDFKILKINPGVLVTLVVQCVGLQSNALHHKGHHVHLLHVLLPQHRD